MPTLLRINKKILPAKKLANVSILIAVGIGLQIAEGMIPAPIDLPGGKLGLANIATLITLCLYDTKTAAVAALLRSVLGSLLYGGVSGLLYSVSGAIVSVAIMAFLLRHATGESKLSLVGVSIIGAVCHNTAQVTAAALVLSNVWIYSYLPILSAIAAFTGLFTGLAAKSALKYLQKRNK